MNKQECKNNAVKSDYSQGYHSHTKVCCKYMECINKGIRKENASLLMLEIQENNINKYFFALRNQSNWTWLCSFE